MFENDELLELEDLSVPMQPYNMFFNLDQLESIDFDDDLLDLE